MMAWLMAMVGAGEHKDDTTGKHYRVRPTIVLILIPLESSFTVPKEIAVLTRLVVGFFLLRLNPDLLFPNHATAR